MKMRSAKPTTSNQQLAAILIVPLLLFCPALAYGYAGGTGEPNDPFQIATAEQLISIGSDPNLLRSHFILINDIDLDPNLSGGRVFDRAVIAPQGDRPREEGLPFKGQFDGQGHVIRNLVMSNKHGWSLGLFGWASEEALIQNVQLEVVQVTGDFRVGSLVGINAGTIVHCVCKSISISGGSTRVGGLAGSSIGNIQQCHFQGQVSGDGEVGGIVGYSRGNVSQCSSWGRISGISDVGGLIGWNSRGTLSQCYSIGEVAGPTDPKVTGSGLGGLLGYHSGTAEQCYTVTRVSKTDGGRALAGLGGRPDTDMLDSFWNTEASAIPDSYSGTGLTTAAMQNINTYLEAGWSISADDRSNGATTWTMPEGQAYPTLAWESDIADLRYAPDLKGISLAEAEGVLRGFGIGGRTLEYVYSVHLPRDFVVSSTPTGLVAKGQRVAMRLSEGPFDWSEVIGDGSTVNPYQIASVSQFLDLASRPELYDRHYLLIEDLDLSPYLFEHSIMGTVYDPNEQRYKRIPFNGSFDGNGHVISNMHIEASSDLGYSLSCGLFGTIGPSAYVAHLSVEGKLTATTNLDHVGLLCGGNWGYILDCHCFGEINSTASLVTAGLFCGRSMGTIRGCYGSGQITYADRSHNIGGFTGNNQEGEISQCAAHVDLCIVDPEWSGQPYLKHDALGLNSYQLFRMGGTAVARTTNWIGGFAGGNSGVISDCYANGTVIGMPQSTFLSGFISVGSYNGGGIVTRCYSTGTVWYGDEMREDGSYLGWKNQLVGHCYALDPNEWDDIHETDIPLLADAQMRDQSSFIGWDFTGQNHLSMEGIWYMPANGAHPELSLLAGSMPLEPDGNGTPESPYLISTSEELASIWYRPLAYYRLDADIDLSGINWNGAVIPWFGGSFDGDGHAVTELTIEGIRNLGLFGVLGSDGSINNLGIVDANITGSGSLIGALAGCNVGGSITNCFKTGVVRATTSSSDYVGGLVGTNDHGSILSCFSTGLTSGAGGYVGGLVGRNNAGHILSSYSTGSVSATGTRYTGNYFGGLVGDNYDGQITGCYSATSIQVYADGRSVGGLVGYDHGGLITRCIWDLDLSGLGFSAGGGIGLTTAEMQTALPFLEAGWDFESVWMICEGKDYPRLQWEQVSCSEL